MVPYSQSSLAALDAAKDQVLSKTLEAIEGLRRDRQTYVEMRVRESLRAIWDEDAREWCEVADQLIADIDRASARHGTTIAQVFGRGAPADPPAVSGGELGRVISRLKPDIVKHPEIAGRKLKSLAHDYNTSISTARRAKEAIVSAFSAGANPFEHS